MNSGSVLWNVLLNHKRAIVFFVELMIDLNEEGGVYCEKDSCCAINTLCTGDD
jgi:hypothetical protein